MKYLLVVVLLLVALVASASREVLPSPLELRIQELEARVAVLERDCLRINTMVPYNPTYTLNNFDCRAVGR